MRIFLTFLQIIISGTFALCYQYVVRNDQISNSTKNYVQLDKVLYYQGENLWFKIYLLDKNTDRLINQDTKINIELIDQKDKSTAIKSVLIANGLGNGNIFIPNNIRTGKYAFIAHTNHSNAPNKTPLLRKEIYIQNTKDYDIHTLSFENNEYASGELVTAKYRSNLSGKQSSKVQLKYEVWNGPKLIAEGIGKDTPDTGETIIQFKLPDAFVDSSYFIHLTSLDEDHQFTSLYEIPYIRKIDLQFFPEGGHLINRVKNNIAFKAIDNNGKPIEVEGFLTNLTNGQKIPFKSYYQGMGEISIIPAMTDKYEARLTKPINNKASYGLPEIKNIGYSMFIDNSQEDHLMINLFSNENSQEEEVVIAIVAQNQTYWLNEEYIGQELLLKVPKIKLPAGIAKIIVFDIDNTPILERIAFVNKKLNTEISTNKENYSPKEFVNIKVKVNDIQGNPVQSNSSLSITDERFSASNYITNTNILSQLLLSSELKGYIPTPGYYFNNQSPKTTKALDLVMLTNGWRSYSWQEVMNKSVDIEVNDFTYNELVSGKVFYKNGKPAVLEKIQIINKLNWHIEEVMTDDEGNFYYGTEFTSEMKDGFFVTIAESSKKVDIELYQGQSTSSNGSSESFESIATTNKIRSTSKSINTSTSLESLNSANTISQINDARFLEEVLIKDKKEDYKNIASGSILSHHSMFDSYQVQRITGDKLNNMVSSGAGDRHIINWIRQVTYVAHVNKPEPGNIILRGSPSSVNPKFFSGGPGPAFFVVDGQPMGNDYRRLNYVDGNQIESIEVIRSPNAATIYGTHAAGGVIFINTKNPEFLQPESKTTKSLNTVSVTTLSQNKVFYSPKYENESQINDPTPDLRTTLHWEPNIVTDENGEATISFYAGDTQTNYVGTLEGIDQNGNLIYEKIFFSIK